MINRFEALRDDITAIEETNRIKAIRSFGSTYDKYFKLETIKMPNSSPEDLQGIAFAKT